MNNTVNSRTGARAGGVGEIHDSSRKALLLSNSQFKRHGDGGGLADSQWHWNSPPSIKPYAPLPFLLIIYLFNNNNIGGGYDAGLNPHRTFNPTIKNSLG